jgi:hypothetical protein
MPRLLYCDGCLSATILPLHLQLALMLVVLASLVTHAARLVEPSPVLVALVVVVLAPPLVLVVLARCR